jgi:hypothetical protein
LATAVHFAALQAKFNSFSGAISAAVVNGEGADVATDKEDGDDKVGEAEGQQRRVE